MEIFSASTEDTKKVAFELASKVSKADVLFLHGDLGSGKTTFVTYFVEALGINNRVQSPTFVIHKVYSSGPELAINHFDLYRITSLTELEDLDFFEILKQENSISLVEWPDILNDSSIAKIAKNIYFEFVDEHTRKIKIEGFENV